MRTLRGLVAAAALISSTSGTPDGIKNTGPITDFVPDPVPANRQASDSPAASSTGRDAEVSPGAIKNEQSPAEYGAIQSVALKVAVASTTTTVAISIATAGATAIETVEAAAKSVADIRARPAVGGDQPIPIATDLANTATSNGRNISNSPIIPGPNNTIPSDESARMNTSLPASLGVDYNSDEPRSIERTSRVRDSHIPPTNGELERRQEVTQNMPNLDSISFQTHHHNDRHLDHVDKWDYYHHDYQYDFCDRDYNIYDYVVAIQLYNYYFRCSNCNGVDNCFYNHMYPGRISHLRLTSRTYYLQTAAPPVMTACTDTTTLCTVTVAYVISMDPTTTSYYTTQFDTTATAGATATQTIYSEDPNGFHVYITTQDDSNGAATATFYFTTPSPTALPNQVTSTAHKIHWRTSLVSAILSALCGSAVYTFALI
ncbi:hypothetical protein Dda_6887 [Drechslerella dactyloides]|uniref:Uncharacterized protein n=1 Tax=Drechslerella dactyloides TaxID=74499 RepID=A0AAD6NJB2_DREDA|nr:hypothetical protein Dda_6887 [Drechslerella dactyloides]